MTLGEKPNVQKLFEIAPPPQFIFYISSPSNEIRIKEPNFN